MSRPQKVITWIFGVLAFILIVGIVLLKIFFPTEKVRIMAMEQGSEALGRPVFIKGVELSFWGGLGVNLDSVVVGNPDGFNGPVFFTTDNVDVKLKLIPLIRQEFRVKRLSIKKPDINMVKLADGSNNYTFAQPDDTTLPEGVSDIPPEGQTAAAAVSFDALEISNGTINYRNDSADFSMIARGFGLATDLENPEGGIYSSAGKLTVESLIVTSKQPVPTVSAELNYKATYSMPQRHVIIDRADFKFNEVELDLAGDFFHTAGAERGKATLKAENISIEDVLSLLPAQSQEELKNFRVSGDFAVDMDVEYDAGRAPQAFVYTGSAVFTDVNLSRRDIIGELKFRRIVIDAKPDNIRLNVQDGTFDGRPIKANVVLTNFDEPAVNGELSGFIDFVFLKPFLPQGGGHDLEGNAQFDFMFSGPVKDYRNMNFSGDVSVENGSYNAAFLPQPIERFTLDASFDQKQVNIRNFYGKTPGSELQFQGRVNNLVPYVLADSVTAREIDLSADGSVKGQVNLEMMEPFLPQERLPEITGTMDIDLAVSGSSSNLEGVRPRGTVTISNASYRDTALPEPIQHFSAQMKVSPDTITVEDMQVRFESSNARFTGKLSEPFPYFLPLKTVDRSKVKKPYFAFRLTTSHFDVDKMFPEATPGFEGEPQRQAGDSMPALLLPDIDGAGTFAADTIVYSRVPFTDITGKIRIENRKIIAYDATGNVYSGKVTGQTTMDLNDFNSPRYSGEFNATQIEANDFMSRFTKFGGHLFGKINISGSYNATGWEAETFMESLNMNGNGTMQEGRLVLGDRLHQGLSSLAERAGLNIDQEQALKALQSKIHVQEGKVFVDKLTTALGGLGDAEVEGFYAFDGVIGYEGSILLSRDLSQQLVSKMGLLGNLLADQNTQRVRLPLAITGTMADPQLQFNFQALTSRAQDAAKTQVEEQVQDKVKEEAGKLIDNLLGGKKKKE